MSQPTIGSLRILIANERADRLDAVAAIVRSLGHELVGSETRVDRVSKETTRLHPDVALVGLGESTQHALDLIGQIVGAAECPVVALLPESDRVFISEAAQRGVYAYVVDADPETLEHAIELVLLRFSEYHGLEGAFGRRALTERAKGILMERHGIDERAAFTMLRDHARRNNKKLVDVAEALSSGQLMIPRS